MKRLALPLCLIALPLGASALGVPDIGETGHGALVRATGMQMAGNPPSAARRIERCAVPIAKWQTRSALRAMGKTKGWKIRRIKSEDGCYELKGWDRSGRAFEALLNPRTFEIVKIDYDEDERDWLKNRPESDN